MNNLIFALIGGLATAFNFLIIIHKIRKKFIFNALIDIVAFVLIVYLTSSTLTGMVIGMIASMLISIYLIFNPVEEPKGFKNV